jgi:hypothetical protein
VIETARTRLFALWVKTDSSPTRRQSIEFDSYGVTLRVAPSWFGKEWTDIRRITFDAKEDGTLGALSVDVVGDGGERRIQIGMIGHGCLQKLSLFLHSISREQLLVLRAPTKTQ